MEEPNWHTLRRRLDRLQWIAFLGVQREARGLSGRR